MEAIKIFRFEYSDGSGIYFRNDGKSLTDLMEFDFRHPNPYEDTPIFDRVGYGISRYTFGFSSLEQLRSWFYSDDLLKKFHCKDVVIAEYLCYAKDVVFGNAQTIFERNNSIGKTQYNIKDYFKLEM